VHLALAQRLESLPAETRDQKIVDLCNGAIASLNKARSLDEVLGIRNTAEAFSTYARKLKCAVEARAMTQLVVLLAEARIGAELQAAQERGEVARHGGDRSKFQSPEVALPTSSDIGIPAQRAAEFKKLADAGEVAIRDEVASAIVENRRPSRERIVQRIRSTQPTSIPLIAARPPELTQLVLWLRSGATLIGQLGTPQEVIERLREHRMPLPEDQVMHIVDFLSLLQGEVS